METTETTHVTTVETPPVTTRLQTRQIVHIAIQLLALGVLLYFCFSVVSPFVNIVTWSAILAITLYPLHQKLKNAMGGRSALAATIITILMLMILIAPAVWVMIRTGGELKGVISDYRAGRITVPPPAESVKSWPVIGNKAHGLWVQASSNLDSLIAKNPAQAKTVVGTTIGVLTSTAKGILFFTAAIIISGVFLSYSIQAANFARTLFNRLINSTKLDMATISAITIRNVVKGILGVAFLQTALAAAGMIFGGVPYAGVWALLCFILAVVQIGTLPVAIGVIVYAWGAASTGTAIFLTIWMLAVGILDNILKPLVMGKGAPVPMLIIFLGAIGGFMFTGFLGMFTGAVILSLGYRLFDIWLKGTEI